MSILTEAFYDRMATDATLMAMLATYNGAPSIFTTDPAPGDAVLPYIVSAGEVAQSPLDTKNSRGREALRDIRIYAPALGSAIEIEAIAERVRTLFHRQVLTLTGYQNIIINCDGPLAADEVDAYGRIISVSITVTED